MTKTHNLSKTAAIV